MADQKKTNKLAKQGSNPLAKADFGEFAGQGFENQTANDIAIPFLGLAQALSPQAQKGDPAYIEGCEPGRMFNTVTQELLPDVVHFVPCYTENVFVEWVPRDSGGGFVDVHLRDSKVVHDARQAAKEGGRGWNELKTPDGNDLVETFYIYGLLLDGAEATSSISPIVIACTSTKIKKYKALMTQLRTIKSNPPMFAFRIAVTTVDEKNKKNQPYKNFHFAGACGSLMESANLPDGDFAGLLEEGSALRKAVKSGIARAAHESQEGREPGSDGDEPF